MRRHMFVRSAVAVAAALGVVTSAVPAIAATGESGGSGEVVLPAGARYLPRKDQVVEAGANGYAHYQEGASGILWTDYRTGEAQQLHGYASPAWGEHSGLRAKTAVAADGRRQVVISNVVGGTTTVDLPQGYIWTSAYTADSVVAYRPTADRMVSGVSVFQVVDGKTVEHPVENLPPNMGGPRNGPLLRAGEQDPNGALFSVARPDGKSADYFMDYGTRTLRPLPDDFKRDYVVLGKNHILTYDRGNPELRTLRRDDPSATTVKIPMPKAAGNEQDYARFGVVGDWIVFRWSLDVNTAKYVQGNRLWAMPVTGGTPRELLPYAAAEITPAPDGSVLVTGGTGAKDWAVRRVTAGADGSPALTTVRNVPPVTAQIEGIALGAGTLSYFSTADANPLMALYERQVALTGAPEATDPVVRSLVLRGGKAPQALGNGRTAYVDGQMLVSPTAPGTLQAVRLGEDARLNDAFGHYVLGWTPGRNHFGDLATGHDDPDLLNDGNAAALWGNTLWRGRFKPRTHKVEAYDLKAERVVETLDIDCSNELQALGRWIYWSCGPDSSGVLDRTTKKSIAVPGGDVLLGDGFTVRHDHTTHKLILTDFSKGAGTAPTSSELGELRDAPAASPYDRRLNWTVDKFGDRIAYIDDEQRVHIKPLNVPRSPLALLDSDAGSQLRTLPAGDAQPWRGSWQLSQAPADWHITVTDAAGRLVRKIHGRQQGISLAAEWDGTTDTGQAVTSGRYTWTLQADNGDGTGMRKVASGAITAYGHATAYRDLDGDGFGELLGITPDGGADLRLGNGRGGVDGKLSGTSWRSATAAAPFGDFNGDRCNDVVVRVASGELRVYAPGCGRPLTSTAPYTRIGGGWNVYDALTSPGDLTGDGRADLIAREASTGDLYLYADNGAQNFKPRVKIGNGWKGYTLTGAGDVNGDGKADLLARDTSGVMWLYPGTGKGTLGTRIKVGGGWQVYNALVGAGDLNGDGKPDLLARGTDGVLWSYAGDGKGNFAGRQRIGGGWQMYKYLF
ncbi:FG-GAP-like repeat-containing protein [Streptomyces sp. NPDC059070]|uniref:FG-GAP-like repeat-containing protein n=1 Tax=Streptomyces sp. NPDC059070 TaxID=3346713 RepID=UPI003694F47F